MEIDHIVEYWNHLSQEKWKTAKGLMSLERYADALFFCHLTLEAKLKGKIVEKTNEQAPLIHNLVALAVQAELDLDSDALGDLREITTFNINARYDDYRREFYKKASKEFAVTYFDKTNNLLTWIENH